VHGLTTHPYETTRAATAGPDIIAMPATGGPADLAALEHLEHAPGVSRYSGPYPMTVSRMRVNGLSVVAIVEGRETTDVTVDQPAVTAGTWVRPGGVVLERAFAEELGIRVGDVARLNGRPYRVVGIAVSAALPPYPYTMGYVAVNTNLPLWSQGTGLVWTTEQSADTLATAASPLTHVLDLKLTDPAQAEAFEEDSRAPLILWSWLDVRAADGQFLVPLQRALLIVTWLLGLLAVASLAVVVGGRMAERTRRVGLLKAIGASPWLVGVVLLVEYLVLALMAAAAGLLCGWLIAPLVIGPGAGLIGTPGSPSLTLATVGWVIAAALVVAVLAAFVPSVRAARTSTTAALADAAYRPKRRALLIAAAARLPVPLLLGLRLAARRPRRMVLTTVSLAVTVTTLVAVITVHAHEALGGPILSGYSQLPNPHLAQTDQVLLVMTVVLVALACVNAVVITWATWLDSRKPLAVARSLGASPRQVAAGLSAALLLPAIPGAVVGIPLGLLLVKAASHGGSLTVPPAPWLVAAVVGTLVVITALSAVPARIGARHPVAEVLQAELA
jgi:putative ABC transport system permease protein